MDARKPAGGNIMGDGINLFCSAWTLFGNYFSLILSPGSLDGINRISLPLGMSTSQESDQLSTSISSATGIKSSKGHVTKVSAIKALAGIFVGGVEK